MVEKINKKNNQRSKQKLKKTKRIKLINYIDFLNNNISESNINKRLEKIKNYYIFINEKVYNQSIVIDNKDTYVSEGLNSIFSIKNPFDKIYNLVSGQDINIIDYFKSKTKVKSNDFIELNKQKEIKLDPSLDKKIKFIKSRLKEIINSKYIESTTSLISKKLKNNLKSIKIIYKFFIKDLTIKTPFSNLHYRIPYTLYYIMARTRKQSFFLSKGLQNDFKLMLNYFESDLNKAVYLSNLLDYSKKVKAGKYNIIADPDLTNVFIHEAFGHSSEYDYFIKNMSILKGLKNKKITNESINIIDNPLEEDSFGSYYFDYEGIPAKKTYILKNGVLNELLNSIRNSNYRNQINKSNSIIKLDINKLTSNGRSESADKISIPRMSNIYITKGDYDLNEMIEELKNGIIMIGSYGGEVETKKGSYLFNSKYGYLIKNKEIVNIISNVSLGGLTLETLNNIIGRTKRRYLVSPGFCGKYSQSVPVGGDSPYVLIKDAYVGGEK